ncbi:hypothetical protein V1520DRAFT_101121 [Lipomyces starkeyi]|uniref:Uncharacterized protein n=1 Tax=Lipomyces starkeyi NRRL Y-11557 TaxID=675824 RepID=A0A1E3QD99_LIPST|nr:hypothetical protein LIPSTDRAFT_109911 [Lipomyces starkeyi NRRL Y-11557]
MDRRTWTVTLVLGSLLLMAVVLLSSPSETYVDFQFNQNPATRYVKKAGVAHGVFFAMEEAKTPVEYESYKTATKVTDQRMINLRPGADEGEEGEKDDQLKEQRKTAMNSILELVKVGFGLRENVFQLPLVGKPGNRIPELPKYEDVAEGEEFPLSITESDRADHADVNHEAINVHIVCSNAVHFDLVLALAGSIMLPPSLQNDEILQNEDIEVAISQTAHSRVNLTIIDATNAAVTTESRYDNAEFDMFRMLMLKEAKLLPIQVVKATELPASAPDVLFLASCLDDALVLYNGIRRALVSNSTVQCVVRHPSLWDSAGKKEENSKLAALAKPYISTGKWSFVATSRSSSNYMQFVFPEVFGVSTLIADSVAVFNPIFPRTTVQTTSVEPGDMAAIIGGDFVRPVNDKRRLYQHTITTYTETAPNITVQLLDFIGGSGKMEKYVIPDHSMLSVARNVPLHTYFERIAQSRVIVPLPVPDDNPELAMRMSDVVATIALSVGRPLLTRKSTYANVFESRIPSDMVIIEEDQEAKRIETSFLAGLKSFARADTHEIYTIKRLFWQSLINKAEAAHDKVMESNWECMNHIIGQILL